MSTASFRLESLRIRGFRGFAEPEKGYFFDLRAPLNVVYGQQGGGKSSTLDAIAWCLFGNAMTKRTQTGLPERRNWMVRHHGAAEARVKLVMIAGEQRLSIMRSDAKSSTQPNFQFQLNAEEVQHDEKALHRILGLSLSDYMSCLHLHQEVLNGLVVQEPKVRKGALDRLMGLTEMREFLDCLKTVKLRTLQKFLKTQSASWKGRQEARLALRRDDLTVAKREALDAGFRDLSDEAILKHCHGVRDALLARGGHEDLESFVAMPSEVTAEHFNSWLKGVRVYLSRQSRKAGTALQRGQDIRIWSDWEEAWDAWRDKSEQVVQTKRALHEAEEASSFDELRAALQTNREAQEALDRRTTLVAETLRYLGHSHNTDDADGCPVCGSEQITRQALSEQLEVWQEEMNSTLQPLQDKALMLQQQLDELQAKQKLYRSQEEAMSLALEMWCAATVPLQAHRDDDVAEKAKMLVASLELPASRGLVDGRASLLALGQALQEAKTELPEPNTDEAGRKEHTVEEVLEALPILSRVLALREELAEMESLQTLSEYEEMQEAQHALQQRVDQMQWIVKGTEQAITDTAREKLRAMRASIRGIYRQLSTRRDFPNISIDPKKYEVVAVNDGEKIPAIQIFNKGDINIAALSLFLALATSGGLSHRCGFLLIDDPTQHMDAAHRHRVMGALAQLVPETQLVVATSEPGLQQGLWQEATVPQHVFTLSGWSAAKGPSLQMERR